MFARFRHVRNRLNVGIVETARVGTKVRQTHIASLGSVPVPASAADRSRFWTKAHQRLSTLSNRLDDDTRLAIMTAINARIPIPTAEDQEAATNAGREANSSFFTMLRDKHRDLAEVYGRAAEKHTAAAKAVDVVEADHASRPMTLAEKRRFLRMIGMTAAELRHGQDLVALSELLGKDDFMQIIVPMLSKASIQAGDRAQRRAARSLLRSARGLQ